MDLLSGKCQSCTGWKMSLLTNSVSFESFTPNQLNIFWEFEDRSRSYASLPPPRGLQMQTQASIIQICPQPAISVHCTSCPAMPYKTISTLVSTNLTPAIGLVSSICIALAVLVLPGSVDGPAQNHPFFIRLLRHSGSGTLTILSKLQSRSWLPHSSQRNVNHITHWVPVYRNMFASTICLLHLSRDMGPWPTLQT